MLLLVVRSVSAARHVFERVINGNRELLSRTSVPKQFIVGRLERACRKSFFERVFNGNSEPASRDLLGSFPWLPRQHRFRMPLLASLVVYLVQRHYLC